MQTPTRDTREPFRGSSAVAQGLITWDRLQGPDFDRLHPDTYVGAAAEDDVKLRAQALATWSRDRGVVAGPLAALAYGADCPWEDAQIVLTQHCRIPPAGTTVRVDRLHRTEIAERFGCRITSPVRTAFDLARRPPLVEAVAAVDALAFRTGFTTDQLGALAARHPGARGTAQLGLVIERIDPRAESLPESRMRLGLIDRGVPHGVPQHRVRLATGERKRLDLAWPDRLVACEYDGPEHRSITGQNRDAFHRARLADLGWHIIVVTSAMLADPGAFDEFAARVLRRVG